MSNEISDQDPALTFGPSYGTHIPKVFVVCDQRDTAPVWGYILRQQGLMVILETSRQKAIDRWTSEAPDLVVLDVDSKHQERMELYKKFREVSVAPILLLLPAYHETQILEAYADLRIDFVDTTIVAVAERLKVTRVLTLDRRHFRVIRPSHCDTFTLLPK